MWTIFGLASVFVAHHLIPGFRLADYFRDDFDAHSFVQQFLGPTSSDKNGDSDAEVFQSKAIDLRVGLSRLNMSITEVDYKIHELMGQHSSEFMERIGQIKQVQDTMASINAHMQAVEKAGSRYVVLAHSSAKKSVEEHLESLQNLQAQSARLNDATNLVARTRNILAVYAKLVDIMDRISSFNMMMSIKDAPLLHQHAEQSISTPPENGRLKTLTLIEDARKMESVATCLSEIPHMQDSLLEQVENVLMCGLRSLSPPLLGTALQAALHLNLLGPVIQNFLDDLNDVLLERSRTSLDLLALGKELEESQPPILSSAFKLHPTESHTLSPSLRRWINTIWERLQTFIVDELGSIVTKVQMLERILQRKYAPQSDETLLDIVVSKLGNTPTSLLWSTCANNMEQLINECIHESDFWWYIFVFSYPKFADLFNMLKSHLAMLSDDFMASQLTSPMERMLAHREKDYHAMLTQKWRSLSQDILKATFEDTNRATEVIKTFAVQLKKELDACMDQAPLQSRTFATAAEFLDFMIHALKASIKKGDEAWSFPTKQLTNQQQQNIRIADVFKSLQNALSEWNVFYQESIDKRLAQWREMIVKTVADDLLSPLLKKVKEETSLSLSRRI
ncbi:hypothetical protein MEQU1_001103 [Malassezia equina]|uniref:Conserved oligomeric Golgi complex subunit 5 n=1 Tax=Malassezia equina TaxID=1381935 RepID=A0AAF0IYN2_9BASI|nr:hypothetical protein MEQU1_001103 [Malassezia equina]